MIKQTPFERIIAIFTATLVLLYPLLIVLFTAFLTATTWGEQ